MKKIIFLFIFIIFPIFTKAQVVINEIGWAGTKASASDEWLELYNNSDNEINLEGFILRAKDGAPLINISGKIAAQGYYLIERTLDDVVSDISADYAGTFGKYGNISNSGEDLELVNVSGEIIDKAYFSSGWPGGSAGPDYFSMERVSAEKNGSDKNNWKSNDGENITGKDVKGNNILGTPKSENSVKEKNKSGAEEISIQEEEKDEEIIFNAGNKKNVKIVHKESSIKPYAGENKLGIAGADIEFHGEAYGLKNELLPRDNLRFIWNFGDGSSKEGAAVSHSFAFPGMYIATLDAARDTESSSHRIFVKIIPNSVKISEVSPRDLWIEIYSGSSETLDISSWQIEYKNKKFIFPKNSFIKEKSYLTIPYSILNINLEKSGEIIFLYPNGTAAQKFSYGNSGYSENHSFSLMGGKTELSVKTPGSENKQAENLKKIKNAADKPIKQKVNFAKKKLKSKIMKMCKYGLIAPAKQIRKILL